MFQSCVVGFLENAVSLSSLQGFDEFSPTLSWHHPFGLYCNFVFLSQLQKCAKISSVHDARKAGSCNTKEEPSVSLTVHMGSIEKKTGTAINRTVTVSSKLFSFTSVCAVYSNIMSVLDVVRLPNGESVVFQRHFVVFFYFGQGIVLPLHGKEEEY